MPHDAQHWNVRVAVAEREALVEIVAARPRMVADDPGLLGARHDGREELPGRDAILHLQAVADDSRATDAVGQVAQDGLERTGDEHYLMPGVAALLDEIQRRIVQGRADHLLEPLVR